MRISSNPINILVDEKYDHNVHHIYKSKYYQQTIQGENCDSMFFNLFPKRFFLLLLVRQDTSNLVL